MRNMFSHIEKSSPRQTELLSVLSRVIPASYFSIACFAFLRNFAQTGKWTSLFWSISEGVVVILFIMRRDTMQVSRRPWDWLVGIGGSFSFLLVRPANMAVVPEIMAVMLQLAGTLFQIYGKFVLGRSFGVMAANRGVVINGPYRVVRHPIYLGYLVTHVGFILANLSTRNMVIYAIGYFFQIARILSEERFLRTDEAYREYCRQVQYRLVYKVF